LLLFHRTLHLVDCFPGGRWYVTDFSIDQLSMEASEKAVLREFVEAWDRHAQPVLFVGAGLSKFEAVRRPGAPGHSEFGAWIDILDDFRHRLSGGDPDIERRLTTDPLRLAQLYEAQFDRRALLARVEHHVPSADFLPGEAHRRLREIPWAAIVTTNYDDLLERAFEPTRPLRRIVTDEDLTGRRPPNELVVIKLHGDLMRPEMIVLSEDDYLKFEESRPGISVKVRQLLIEHPLLFLGFSLSDPNFARIDRWIRDTIGKVRLPAVSIVHDEPLPGERNLWTARGIKLVRLSRADSMPRLLEALAAARPRRIVDAASRQNERVPRLEAQVFQIALKDEPDRAERIAVLLWEILAGATSDRDGGAEARRVAVHFCHGWHMLSTVGAPRAAELPPPVTAKEVYAHLAAHRRRMLLMMALEGGTDTLRIDATPVDIVGELLGTSLSSDERATVYLHHARLLRDLGRTSDAARALTDAEESNPRKELQARIALEVRELAFQDGDKARLEAALRRPLADDADVLERCRRGSDSLLLGRREDADRWYKEALDRATTGDERVAALWGRLISRRRGLLIEETEEERMLSAEIRHDPRSVPEVDQPASVHARELAEQAGTALLDGKPRELAVEQLQAYLDEMRRLGWPHSPTHDLRTPMEITAHQSARLLLEGDDGEEGDDDEEGVVRRVIEALVILNRYGLANDIRELFKHRHCELLSRAPQSVAWFRSFAAARPTLARCADARLATAVAGIALLADDAIETIVATVIERIDARLADATAGDLSTSLEDWWQDIVAASHHLPAGAAKRVLEAHGRYLRNRRALAPLGSPPLTEFWLQQGVLERGGPEARLLAERGRAALEEALRVPRDPFWLREITNCLGQSAEDQLFGEAERAVLQETVRAALEAESARGATDGDAELQLAALLAALHPDGRIDVPVFATRACGLVVQNARSTSLGLALHCAEAALDTMPMADREALLQALCDIGERLITRASDDGYWDRGAGSLAKTLAAVAVHIPAARDRIASLLFRLAERHTSGLVGLGRLPSPSPEESARSAGIAEAALFSASAARRDRILRSITGWLHSSASPAVAEQVLDVALGLCLSDAPETRRAAIYAVLHRAFTALSSTRQVPDQPRRRRWQPERTADHFFCCCDDAGEIAPGRRSAPWRASIQPGYSGGSALTSPSFFSSSVVSWISGARRLSLSWSRRLAPMMTEVTASWWSSQASAIVATEASCAAAIGRIASITRHARSLSTGGKSNLARRPASSVAPGPYLPVNRPPASGLHTRRPTRWSRSSGMISRSRSRPAIV
jgi:hypothetical protein